MTTIRVLEFHCVRTSNLYGREEYEGAFTYYEVGLEEPETNLSNVLRGFRGARKVRAYLKRVCLHDLNAKTVFSTTVDIEAEEDEAFNVSVDLVDILKRAGAKFTTSKKAVEHSKRVRYENDVVIDYGRTYVNAVFETLITIID